jgi:predicted nucleic acid-binding protein
MDSRRAKVTLALDASVAVAWHVTRNDPQEAVLAQEALQVAMSRGALVPFLWYTEVANAILVAERRQISDPESSVRFLADLDSLPITMDSASPRSLQAKTLNLARTHQLTAYDATYFELASRKNAYLATFDRQLADAFRKAGGHVFGDTP